MPTASKPPITVEAMRSHIDQLVDAHQIVRQTCTRSTKSNAIRSAEEIIIAPIRSAITYAVALHEIGHIKGRHQTSPFVIVRERWAWNWARSNAMGWTPRMEKNALQSMEWYVAAIADGRCERRVSADEGNPFDPPPTWSPDIREDLPKSKR